MESGRPEMASANTTEFVPGTRIDRHQYPMVRAAAGRPLSAASLVPPGWAHAARLGPQVDHYKKLDHKSLNKEARCAKRCDSQWRLKGSAHL